MKSLRLLTGILLTISLLPLSLKGAVVADYEASLTAGGGSGHFAPYYIMSGNFGVINAPWNALARIKAERKMPAGGKRLDYGFGADIIGGASSSIGYLRYNVTEDAFHSIPRHQPRIWLQQLYASIKWRSIFLTAGLKETGSAMLDDNLTSGDLVWSSNARPVPGVRAGFIDFRPIPFTAGLIEINGELFYGKPTDNAWLRDHYDYYNWYITTGSWINYKRVYFRTDPSRRVSVTIGMQAAAQFGGTQHNYLNGRLESVTKAPCKLKTFIEMMVPMPRGTSYYNGNHLGSWDICAKIRLKNDDTLRPYVQWPWEDGSGIGKLNGFDGLWGIEYRRHDKGHVTAAVVEWLDFTNQSGPLHWDPADMPGTTITSQATGSDSYYNNYFYNGYAVYGMAVGSPWLTSPVYNRDGYMRFTDTSVRGIHAAVDGYIDPHISYRIKASWREAWGDPYVPRARRATDTSVALKLDWSVPQTPGLHISADVAMDRGDIFGNNLGAVIAVRYCGSLTMR